MDIGESIVGSYLRHIRGCDLVLYNERLQSQGELDVIGIKTGPQPKVWLCEVATHLGGLGYGDAAQNKKKIEEKIAAARVYATRVFHAHEQYFELWSPYVPVGKNTQWMAAMSESDQDLNVQFVINSDYTAAVQALLDKARGSTSNTGEPAYRMLQVLTHLRGGHLRISDAGCSPADN